jgi:hypothetical protein
MMVHRDSDNLIDNPNMHGLYFQAMFKFGY